ncbi:acyl-CoA N-acyltransferase [Daedalea quercina L-15889]|uniref:Acyl-CoA N-acyltransferase n=1 Tax=Daedalea quercina L-15889 TaxID=1314783 RepID=A0A165L8L2_9APHY|nr:acyl-CoA N-acyltransferase [Daedalea quercina L-15889]
MSKHLVVYRFRSASAFLDACESALLETRSISANFALTTTYAVAKQHSNSELPASEHDYWFSAFLAGSDWAHNVAPVIALALVGGHAGRLASSIDTKDIPPPHIAHAVHQLVQAAKEENVPGSRIFGVIGPKALCEPFADAWGSAYGLQPRLVMDFSLTHVTQSTLRPPTCALGANVTLGLCTPADLDVAAAMCERATHPMDEPVPPPLDAASAFSHAKSLIEGGHLYGARIDGILRSLVSITRETPGVRAVSKVYTDSKARGQGLAEALVQYAIGRVFEDQSVQSVCLFFEPSNPSAVRLYKKIGFSIASDENEEWAEFTWEAN